MLDARADKLRHESTQRGWHLTGMKGDGDGNPTLMGAEQLPQAQDANMERVKQQRRWDSRCGWQISQGISNEQWSEVRNPGGRRASSSHKQAKMKFRDAIFVEERKHSQPSESTGVAAFVIQN